MDNLFKEFMIVLLILFVLALSGVFALTRYAGASTTEFKSACTKTGGEPVHDGRQWQCLKPVTQPLT